MIGQAALTLAWPPLATGLLALLAWALGRRVLFLRGESPLLRESARLMFGLVVVATVLLGLGLTGQLLPLPLALAALGLAFCGRWRIEAVAGCRRCSSLWILAVGGAGSFLLALYPPTAFDVTLYHLPYVSAFVEGGSLAVVPQLRYPIFPQLLELLAVPLYLAAGETAPSFLSVLSLLAVAAGILGLLGPNRVGLFATALWVGSPLVVRLGSQLMVEMTLTAFVFFGLVGVWRLQTVPSDARSQREWAILAGACLGAAAASKYLGLFFLAVVPLQLLGRRTRRQLPWVLLCALVVAGPWYGRLVAVTGNPVFPFLEKVFGSSVYSQEKAPINAQLKTPGETIEKSDDLPASVASLVLGGRRGSRAPPFNPWLLIAALGVWGLRPTRSRLLFGGALLLYGLFWVFLPRDPRFLLPCLPWLAIVGGASLDRLLSGAWIRYRPDSRATAMVALVLLLPGLAYGLLLLWRVGPVPITEAAQQSFRAAQMPGYRTLEAWRALDEKDQSRIYLLGRENLQYFGEGRAVGDHFGPLPMRRVLGAFSQPCRLAAMLREQEIDYLLVAGHRSPDRFGPCLERVKAPPPDTLWRVPDE